MQEFMKVNPNNIVDRYKSLDEKTIEYILKSQDVFWKKIQEDAISFYGGKRND